MHGIYKLKEKLCEELEEYGSREGGMSTGTLDTVDKLAHTIKNLDKIIETYEEEDGYSGNYMYADGANYEDGRSMRGGNRSYARGRNARRDSMGRYSRAGDMVEQLRNLMSDAPDERTRKKIQSLISEMEMM